MGETSAQAQFARALEQLMERKPLSQIRASQVIGESGLSRQTFYRYFRDLYDLIDWVHLEKTRLAFELFDVNRNLEESWCVCLQLMLGSRTFYRQAMTLEGYNSFYRSYYLRCQKNLLRYLGQGLPADAESTQFAIHFAAAGITQTLLEWIRGGMVQPPCVMAKRFVENMPDCLRRSCDLVDSSTAYTTADGDTVLKAFQKGCR